MDPATKDVEAYKTIKVPLWVYENAKEVELALIKKGLERIPPEILEPQNCPICKSKLEPFKTEKKENEYLRCAHCGYTQQRFATKERFMEGVVLGTAIGMGLIYFLNALFGNGKRA
jgi:DNA-directed RNA polymerase subunit RPC12/RpoP